jgi:hypothetical protein
MNRLFESGRDRPPRGWFWRCFRDRPRPEDARDAICTGGCSMKPALRWYCVTLAYYKFQRDWNRGLYRFWQVIAILFAASIPVVAGIPSAPRWAAALATAITATSLAFITLFGWRKDYERFTRTAIELRIEAEEWDARLGHYATTEDVDQTFRAEVIRIIEREVEVWQPGKELEDLEARLQKLEADRQAE